VLCFSDLSFKNNSPEGGSFALNESKATRTTHAMDAHAQIASSILSLVASGETDTKSIHATLVKEFQESAPSHNQVKKQFAAIRRGAEAEEKAKIDAANDRIKAAIQTRDSVAIKKAVRKNKEDAAPHIVDMAKRHIEQLSQGPKLNTKNQKRMERGNIHKPEAASVQKWGHGGMCPISAPFPHSGKSTSPTSVDIRDIVKTFTDGIYKPWERMVKASNIGDPSTLQRCEALGLSCNADTIIFVPSEDGSSMDLGFQFFHNGCQMACNFLYSIIALSVGTSDAKTITYNAFKITSVQPMWCKAELMKWIHVDESTELKFVDSGKVVYDDHTDGINHMILRLNLDNGEHVFLDPTYKQLNILGKENYKFFVESTEHLLITTVPHPDNVNEARENTAMLMQQFTIPPSCPHLKRFVTMVGKIAKQLNMETENLLHPTLNYQLLMATFHSLSVASPH